MGAIFSRIKTWVSTEDVTYSDLNAEFDNILTNLVPAMIDDYSANVSQMQTQTDPGEVGTESLATTLAGEIARLRFMIKEITGESYWYTSSSTSLAGLSNVVGSGLTENRLVSGRLASSDNQPMFLIPNGAARTVKLDGTPTNFIYYIEGVEYTISSDVTLTNLTAAPSSNNTCLVNDSIAADQEYTKYTGEFGSEIPIDTVGSEVTALVGKYAAFKLAGVGTEYFIAKVETNKLVQAKRGYFFDSTDAAIPRTGYTDNDVITLMKLSWIFAKSDGTLTATYNNPLWSFDEPSSPSIGDYWFDYGSNKWKRYDVSSYIGADAMLVGVCIQDTSNTVAARSFDFFDNYNELNTVEVIYESATQVKARFVGSQINVYGNVVLNDHNVHTWDMTADLDSGVSEAASTMYYFYIKDTGDKVISDVRPYDRKEDLRGMYHPHKPWRCVGYAFNNGSQNLGAVESYFKHQPQISILPAQTVASRIETLDQFIPVDTTGGAFTKTLPPSAYTRGQRFVFNKISADTTLFTIATTNSENIIFGGTSATSITMDTNGETVELYSNGLAYYGIRRYSPMTSTVEVHTGNGHGSTNTKIRRFTTTKTNTGSAITYADSATLGASFTINESGLYSIQYWDVRTAASERIGLSLNTTTPTTNINSIAEAERMGSWTFCAAATTSEYSWTGRLSKGDVVRPHTEGACNTVTAGEAYMRMVKIGN